MSTLCTYSWKTIIWAEVLKEFGNVFWFDTSIEFFKDKDRGSMVKILQKYFIGQSSSFLYYVHKGVHNLTYATHANMFSYLPVNFDKIENEQEKCSMSQANGVMIINTNEVKNYILKWGLLCALTKDCIAPPSVWNEKLRKKVDTFCPKSKELPGERHVCHRYDQSLFSILVRNYYMYDGGRYQIQSNDECLGAPFRMGGNS